MEKADVKILIWQLDAALVAFSGVGWMKNVGRVARLKEVFFSYDKIPEAPLCPLSQGEIDRLNNCLKLLVDEDTTDRTRSAAFNQAEKLIISLLPGGQE